MGKKKNHWRWGRRCCHHSTVGVHWHFQNRVRISKQSEGKPQHVLQVSSNMMNSSIVYCNVVFHSVLAISPSPICSHLFLLPDPIVTDVWTIFPLSPMSAWQHRHTSPGSSLVTPPLQSRTVTGVWRVCIDYWSYADHHHSATTVPWMMLTDRLDFIPRAYECTVD